ncbi:MAG: hypothetical protein H0W90_08905 [Actinobacteria bacterium]|nr:hypothetical protein [Actinomycetota bacterium]
MNNPDSSQYSIASYGDFDLASAYADSGVNSLIQIGVTYDWSAGQSPDCRLGSSSPALYYFVEVRVSGTYSCYQLGTAAGGASNLQSVQRGSDNLWHAYKNGVGSGISTSWSACGGNACTLSAFAENLSQHAGLFYAKFAGANPWQFYNSCCWNTINNPTIGVNPPWQQPVGPFPAGIWYFKYSK